MSESLKLKEIREAKNLSQKEAAKILSISQGNLSKYERGLAPISEELLNNYINLLSNAPTKDKVIPQKNNKLKKEKPKKIKKESIRKKQISKQKKSKKEHEEFICPFIKEKENEIELLKNTINTINEKLKELLN
jgi:transcriptional regulator with XRE-family HTH domain